MTELTKEEKLAHNHAFVEVVMRQIGDRVPVEHFAEVSGIISKAFTAQDEAALHTIGRMSDRMDNCVCGACR